MDKLLTEKYCCRIIFNCDMLSDYNKYDENRYEIIAMNHSFHGRSMGALSVTGNKAYFLTDSRYIESAQNNIKHFDVLEMMKRIEADYGVKTQLLSNLKLKPIATHGAGLSRGLNTINYHGEFGSKFCMELIGLEEETERL